MIPDYQSNEVQSNAEYCITGIFPGTFISRKMMFSTFSRFLISRPVHGCTDIEFTESVCFRF